MSIRLAITLFVLYTITASPAKAGSVGPQTTPPSSTNAATSVRVIEFYHKGLDHYFVTANPVEISALEDGGLQVEADILAGLEDGTLKAASSARSPRPRRVPI